MRYLWDTNAVTALGKNNPALWVRLRLTRLEDASLSAIVAHETFYGAFRGQRTERTLAQIADLPFRILPFDASDARKAGEIRAALVMAGTPIGPYDVPIAGQALARDLTPVIRNIRDVRPRPGPAGRGLGGRRPISRSLCPAGA